MDLLFSAFVSIFTLVFSFSLFSFLKLVHRNSVKKFPSGPPGLPFIGNLLEFRESPLNCLIKWKKDYGPIVGLRLGMWRTVVINNIEWIKEAFHQEAFNGRPEFAAALLFTGGVDHGTLTSTGDPWETIRKFTVKNLNTLGFGKHTFMETFLQDDISELVLNLRKDSVDQVTPISLHGRFYIPAINNLWLILSGDLSLKRQSSEVTTMLLNLNKSLWRPIGDSIWMMPWLTHLLPEITGYGELRKALQPFKDFVRTAIDKTKRSMPSDENDLRENNTPSSLIEAFLNEIHIHGENQKSHFNKTNGIAHLESMVMNLFVTAAEAMNNTMNWAVFYLSLYPKVQGRLAEEILQIKQMYGNLPRLDDVNKMPYTKAVMQEMLRIASTSPFSNFQATTCDVEFKGYTIPKGIVVIANLYGLHHDNSLWENPELFNPERFLLGECGKNDKTSPLPLVPFSVGLRTCPGQTFSKNEFFLMLTSLVYNFRFEGDESVKQPTAEEIIQSSKVSIFRFCPEFKVICKYRESGNCVNK